MDELPRYFTARGSIDARSASPAQPDGVLDRFWLQTTGAATECVVTTDGIGGLAALCGEESGGLREDLRSELAYDEVSTRGQGRRIAAERVYLFNAQLLEQPPGAPGPDDSLYLYGTLFGPYPHIGPTPPVGVEVQLTLSRSELLAGILHAAPDAFRYAAGDGEGEEERRCFHATLPGDRQDEIDRGRGIILAYPLLPAELCRHDGGNELVVRQLLYDVLTALRDDLDAERIAHPLRGVTIPVPSRNVLEAELRANGYEIEGVVARRAPGPSDGIKGLLGSVFGRLMDEQVELPPEGSLPDYLRLAQRVLEQLPGFASTRALSLQRRVTRSFGAPTTPRIPHVSTSTPTRLAVQPSGPRPTLTTRADPAEWMRDFVPPGRNRPAEPRVTSTRAVVRDHQPDRRAGASQSESRHSREDSGASPRKAEPGVKRGKEAPKPEWMSDFE